MITPLANMVQMDTPHGSQASRPVLFFGLVNIASYSNTESTPLSPHRSS